MKHLKLFEMHSTEEEYIEKLTALVTVNTFKGSDKFHFKNAVEVGTVDGYPVYVTFYYSHYNEYLVFSLAWTGGNAEYKFSYLNHHDMLPNHKHREHVFDIKENYLELIYNATQQPENIEFSKYYASAYDRNREITYIFRQKDDDETYNRFDPETYVKDYPLRLEISEFMLLHDRYVNLKPDVKREEELKNNKSATKEEILSKLDKALEMDKIVKDIMSKRDW